MRSPEADSPQPKARGRSSAHKKIRKPYLPPTCTPLSKEAARLLLVRRAEPGDAGAQEMLKHLAGANGADKAKR